MHFSAPQYDAPNPLVFARDDVCVCVAECPKSRQNRWY